MAEDIAVYSAPFNPPGVHNLRIAQAARQCMPRIIVFPCGAYPENPPLERITPEHRAAMCQLTFGDLEPCIRLELADLEEGAFTVPWNLQERYGNKQSRVWHIVSARHIADGKDGASIIQTKWTRGREMWAKSHFLVVRRSMQQIDEKDLPPNHRVLNIEGHDLGTHDHTTGKMIRDRVFNDERIDDLVVPQVRHYIKRHKLYHGTASRFASLTVDLSDAELFSGGKGESVELFRHLRRWIGGGWNGGRSDSENPSVIMVIGGDGTMLKAVHEHGHRRIPFLGLNTGTRGHLLNSPTEVVNRDNPHAVALHTWMLRRLVVNCEDEFGRTYERLAFNDAWLERAEGQTAHIDVRINAELAQRFVTDNVLVSTAQGATAYARAMGGPFMPLNAQNLVFGASNLIEPEFWGRPVGLPIETRFHFVGQNLKKRPLRAFVDSERLGHYAQWMSVRASRTACVELAFLPAMGPDDKYLHALLSR